MAKKSHKRKQQKPISAAARDAYIMGQTDARHGHLKEVKLSASETPQDYEYAYWYLLGADSVPAGMRAKSSPSATSEQRDQMARNSNRDGSRPPKR